MNTRPLFPLSALRGTLMLPLIAALGPLALAQPSDAAPSGKPAFELSERAMTVQSVGLSLRLPLGSRYETKSMTAGDASFTMISADDSWRLRLHTPSSRDHTLTAADVADTIVDSIQRNRQFKDPKTQSVIASGARIFDRVDNLVTNGASLTRFYALMPPLASGEPTAAGYSIYKVAPGRFAVLEMDCLERDFERVREEYETVMGAVTIRDPSEMVAERLAGVRAADSLLNSLTREDLEAALPPSPALYRIYRPAPTGADSDATEIAYQRVEIRTGFRGELDPDRPRRRWRALDKQEGIIARVTGRSLDGGRFIDSDALYFLSFDAEEEAWAVRNVIRDGEQAHAITETGVRESGSIKVTVDQPGAPPILKHWRRPPEAYLPQTHLRLLPRLLVRTGAPTIFNFYCYQTLTTEIVLRRELLEGGDTNAAGDPTSWILRSRPDENAAEVRTLLDAEGALIRRELANEMVMEPVTLERLRAIWSAKGVPLSDTEGRRR